MMNRIRTSGLLSVVGALALMWSGPAAAQFSFNVADVTTPVVLNPCLDGCTADESEIEAEPVYVYVPDPQRSRANLATFVARTRQKDSAAADNLEALLARVDVIGAIAARMSEVGLNHADVADAYAVWMVGSWQAVNGETRPRGAEVYRQVSDQMRRALAGSSQLAEADDAKRQELAEALLLQTAMIDALAEQYAENPRYRRQIADAVRQGARTAGVDIDALTLTRTGFRQR